ncbi:MAG: hypothetical protein KC493_00460 [Bacteriovoracaceae bacterium]|nr:hypothetical protein [Bacteriovoracaceae bacterium]
MSKGIKIYGIYSDGPVFGKTGNFYQIVHLFSSRGRIEHETLLKLYQHHFSKDSSEILFDTKDDLNKFLYYLIQEEDVSAVCILSVEEFNQCSEGIFTKPELLKSIEDSAFCIENMDFRPKRGIFDKMFS